ncbi:hypothetical protein [Hydrogenophaga sp.]|uniref:hypothetical protein n=1 Tax=Hydrogenophaga sp. TaxID=1904254 RepID=UPI003D123DCD
MEFPQALFRMPGVEMLDLGGFTTILAHDEADREAKFADGFHATQEEARAAYDAALKAADAPSRAELEQKATELGITFDGRTKDAKLAAAIDAALKAAA